MKRTMTLACATMLALSLALTACGWAWGERGDVAAASAIQTPAYYVFESTTSGGDTITDPNELYLDKQGEVEPWYHLSVVLLDEGSGRIITDGRQADFTYDRKGKTITLHMRQDFGFDGAKLEVGDGTLTLSDFPGATVLRLAEEPPGPFAPRE